MKNTATSSGSLKVTTPTDREIAMTRVFDAPRHLVFEALTKPELVKQWLLGPPGCSMPVCEIDLRVGGAYRFVWRIPDGSEMGVRGVFREVVAPERFVATEKFDQAWYPGEALVTNLLVEQGGQTTLTLTVRYESREARDIALKTPMDKGVAASYDRLAELMEETGAKKLDLVITRIFDAPIERVWKAWSDPEQVMQWWGPDCFTSPIAKIDFREGGTSLVCMRAPKKLGGQDMYSTWAYRKIVPLQRIEYIHNLADKDGNKVDPVSLGMPPDFPQDQRNLVTFKAVGANKTEMTVTEYDWTAGSPMLNLAEIGLKQCLDKMAASLSKT
jgi:uncharacterized protein YndB with AHSA1/START domain